MMHKWVSSCEDSVAIALHERTCSIWTVTQDFTVVLYFKGYFYSIKFMLGTLFLKKVDISSQIR